MFLSSEQKDAVSKLKNGSVLYGTVGSGKSRMALAYYYICNGGKMSELNTAPTTKKIRGPDIFIITTARKRDSREWEHEFEDFNFCCTIKVDSWNNIEKYTNVQHAFFIFDEQRVSGGGKWSKIFIKITRSNQWILLTGTPGDNWLDYVPIFIANGYFKNKTEFNREHVVYSHWTNYAKVERYLNTGKLERLRRQILVEVKYQTPAETSHVYCNCDYDISAYKNICKTRWNQWTEEPITNATEFCYCLRRCVNSDPSRINYIKHIFNNHPRLIIFYNFDYELDILKSGLVLNNATIAEWNGHKHEEVPDTESWIYLVQYSAGAEAWNCTKTDTMIFYSQNYSYKTTVQAAGRINRRNTPYKKLHYYHFVSKAGIDIAIRRALNQKKNFNEKAFRSYPFRTKK